MLLRVVVPKMQFNLDPVPGTEHDEDSPRKLAQSSALLPITGGCGGAALSHAVRLGGQVPQMLKHKVPTQLQSSERGFLASASSDPSLAALPLPVGRQQEALGLHLPVLPSVPCPRARCLQAPCWG